MQIWCLSFHFSNIFRTGIAMASSCTDYIVWEISGLVTLYICVQSKCGLALFAKRTFFDILSRFLHHDTDVC